MTDDPYERLTELSRSVERLARQLADTLNLAPMHAELTETLTVAAGKRGSRRWGRSTWEPFRMDSPTEPATPPQPGPPPGPWVP